MKENKKIYFAPKANESNAYVKLMQEAFYEAGFSQANMWKATYFSLNWLESVPNVGRLQALEKMIQRFCFVFYLIIFQKKIIWTFHNRRSHNQTYTLYENTFRKLLAHFSSFIIIHSESSREILLEEYPYIDTKKVLYLPHPSYIGTYPESTKKIQRNETENIIFTFIGSVSPYKNVEYLMSAFRDLENENVVLKVYGKASEAYKKRLESLPKGRNTTLNLQFVDDAQMSEIMQESDIIITPYNLQSALNSGTHILAFSYGMTVLTTPTCTVLDIPHELWFEIDQSEELEKAICKAVQNVVSHYDRGDLETMGEKLREMMVEKHSIESISDLMRERII